MNTYVYIWDVGEEEGEERHLTSDKAKTMKTEG